MARGYLKPRGGEVKTVARGYYRQGKYRLTAFSEKWPKFHNAVADIPK